MDIQNLDTQYKLFRKYWQSGYENESIKDFQTADNLRKKMIPLVETLVDDENKVEMSGVFADFSDFLFDYFLCQNEKGGGSSSVQEEIKSMAEKTIALDPDSFSGHYFLVVYHSWNLKTAHSGNTPAVYKGQGAADSIVGTALNLLIKGVTLGATAAAAGISNSTFNGSLQNLIAIYKKNLQDTPVGANYYLGITSRIFKIADYCEDIRNTSWRDIYQAVQGFDINQLDYSGIEEDLLDEAREQAMEFSILADSKL